MIYSSTLTACCAVTLLLLSVCSIKAADDAPFLTPGTRLLFQGDSITDGNRGRNADPNHILGHGYVFIISAKYGALYPDRKVAFINRGWTANKVDDLAKRWQTDTLDLKPTLLSILIGINDLNSGVTAEQYEQKYGKLLEETVKALPNVQLVLGEPFGLPTGKKADEWQEYSARLKQWSAIVDKLAEKYHAPVVHYQKVFDEATRRAPAEYWIWDGVHPTFSGHQLMADEWVRTVDEFYSKKVLTTQPSTK